MQIWYFNYVNQCDEIELTMSQKSIMCIMALMVENDTEVKKTYFKKDKICQFLTR